jgi:hypothetical protein
MGLPVLLEEICRLILGIYKSLRDTVKIGAEAALFPEKEYINGTVLAVRLLSICDNRACAVQYMRELCMHHCTYKVQHTS